MAEYTTEPRALVAQARSAWAAGSVLIPGTRVSDLVRRLADALEAVTAERDRLDEATEGALVMLNTSTIDPSERIGFVRNRLEEARS